MASQELLFSLLRFVALVSPAIAILMQLLESTDESDSPGFKFLEIGFLLVIIGGVVIFYQLIQTIDEGTVRIGTAFIFGSLIFFALGIAWRAIPGTEDVEVSIDSIDDVKNAMGYISSRGFAFIIPFFALGLITGLIRGLANQYLNLGLIRGSTLLTPAQFFAVVMFLLEVRVIYYLIASGYLTKYSNSEVVFESAVATVVFPVATFAMILPGFLVNILLTLVSRFVYPISASNLLHSISYLWIIIVLLAVVAMETNGEESPEERFAAD